MVMGFGSCQFECGNPNNSESAHDLDFPDAAVDHLGKRDYRRYSPVAYGLLPRNAAARLLHHTLGRAPKPFTLRDARKRVRLAASAAGLPRDLTLAACRHGGLTELGDAELTEQGVMALSGHKDARSARLYVKRTEAQRLAAAAKRRAWVDASAVSEQKEPTFRNGGPAAVSE